jgi:very-short-patch-repair endonuclease
MGEKKDRYTKEYRKKMSISVTRALASPEVRAKKSAAQLGKKHTIETLAKMSASIIRALSPLEVRARMSAVMKGRRFSAETRKKMSESAKRHWTPENRARLSATQKRNYLDPAHCEKMGAAWNMKPNKPETFLLGLLEELYPGEWKYTGDFSLTINGKCPDFANVKGQKKVIELFGDYWHKGEDPKERAAVFAPYGYTTLVIWQSELKNKKKVAGRIRKFAAQ